MIDRQSSLDKSSNVSHAFFFAKLCRKNDFEYYIVIFIMVDQEQAGIFLLPEKQAMTTQAKTRSQLKSFRCEQREQISLGTRDGKQ